MHEGALAGPQVNPALGLQAMQGLTDRLAAHTQLPGQLGLHQMLAGPQPAPDDELHECLVNRLPQRHRPLNGRDHRCPARRSRPYDHADLPISTDLAYRLLYAKCRWASSVDLHGRTASRARQAEAISPMSTCWSSISCR